MGFLRDKLRPFGGQDGMALIVALGMLLVLGTAATTVIYYSSTNARSSTYSKSSGTSFQLAEAGLHEALAVLSNQPANDPTDPALLPPPNAPRVTPYSTGSVTWSGSWNGEKWTVTSTGRAANPAGGVGAETTRTITAKIPIRPQPTQALALESWNYIFSYGTGDPTGCDMRLTSSVVVRTRLLASGNLCLDSSARIEGASSEVSVGGQTKIYGSSASLGNFGASPVGRLDSNGCRYEDGGVVQHDPCQGPPANADRVWASTITSEPELLPEPTPDFSGWYNVSSPGPTENCTGVNRTGTPPTFDVDLVRNRNAPAANLTPSASYTCRTYIGTQLLGELSWNNSSSAKRLTIHGTVFIDGNAQVTQAAEYTGQGALYLSGSFYIGGSARMCAVRLSVGGECNFTTGAGAWDPNTKLFTVVTNGAGGFSGLVAADTTVNIDSSAQWQGAIYGGPYKARVQSSAKFAGPIIADEVVLSSSIEAQSFGMISTVPSGMPGNQTIQARPDKLELFSG